MGLICPITEHTNEFAGLVFLAGGDHTFLRDHQAEGEHHDGRGGISGAGRACAYRPCTRGPLLPEAGGWHGGMDCLLAPAEPLDYSMIAGPDLM